MKEEIKEKQFWHDKMERPMYGEYILCISHSGVPLIAGPFIGDWECLMFDFNIQAWAYIRDIKGIRGYYIDDK